MVDEETKLTKKTKKYKPKKVFFKREYLVGVAFGAIALIITILFFSKTFMFVPFLTLSLVIASSQMWMDYFLSIRKERDLEEKFPEYVRNLVGAIKSGLSVSGAIIHVSQIKYGALTPYVRKLANQVTWSMPLHRALANFANATENKMIKRAIATVIEAKESGGSLEEVLETITTSVVEIKKIKEKRRTEIFAQIMQNYFIFFVFLSVMVVIQNILLPYVSGLGTASNSEVMTGSMIERNAVLDFSSVASLIISLGNWFISLNGVFVMVAVIQGFFAGVVIGKLSEGNIKYGFKHSFILVVLGFLIMTMSQGMAA